MSVLPPEVVPSACVTDQSITLDDVVDLDCYDSLKAIANFFGECPKETQEACQPVASAVPFTTPASHSAPAMHVDSCAVVSCPG